MRYRLFLLFLLLILAINVEARTLSDVESMVVNKFEDDKSTELVEDEGILYIDVPKGVTLISASLDIEGSNVENVRIKIDEGLLFENSSLSSVVNLDLINNVSTNCDIICRWKLDIKSDGDIIVKNLFVNYSFSKTPLFFKYMQDVKFNGSKERALDLDDYFYGNDIKYKNMTSKSNGLDHVNVLIDSNGRVSFFSELGWEGTGYVYFVADDNIDSARSNEIKLIVGGGQEKAYQFFPVNSTVSIIKGQQEIFGVSGSGSFKVDWYVNNGLMANNSYTYNFSSNSIGIYNLEARIGSTKRLWVISVLEPEIISPEINYSTEEKKVVCGDGIRDESENCFNCPADVSCGANARCVNGVCVLEEKDSIFNSKMLVFSLIGFGLVILLVVIIIILFKKGKLKLFKFSKKIREVKIEEKEDLGALRSYLLDNLNKGYNKDDLIKSALEGGWKREQIDKILNEQPVLEKRELMKELEPLREYIINGLKNGFKREDLINAALKIGWKREQIDEVLKWV